MQIAMPRQMAVAGIIPSRANARLTASLSKLNYPPKLRKNLVLSRERSGKHRLRYGVTEMTPDLWMTILFKMLLTGTLVFGTLLASWRVIGWVYRRKLDKFIGYWLVFAMVIVCLMALSGIAVM